jgi:hypothetical protein
MFMRVRNTVQGVLQLIRQMPGALIQTVLLF